MDLYARNAARNASHNDRPPDWPPPAPETGLEESMRQLGLWGREFYPERPGVADCTYYMRTGSCGYGSKCRYNHPRDRSSVGGGVVRVGEEEYPERVGEPPCQYYLRTGTCKFGASCKFHHPRHAGGSLSNVPLNIYGYPLRPEEKECSYYLKTGQCKFGITCKFHHPQPAGVSAPVSSARPFYPTVQSSSSVPSAEQFGGAASTGYRVARPPLLPGSYVPGAYGAMLLPPGVVPVQNWSPYSGPVSPALSPSAQPSVGAASLYGMPQSAPTYGGGPYSPLQNPTSSHGGESRVILFPVRPGQPECQYYMKTGDCKYGLSCKYHHPPDWPASLRNCALSSEGLPLRPGVQPCSFYLQNGHCKFGQTCKFDHPTGGIRYSVAASSPTDIPIAPSYMLGYSSSLPTMGVGPSSIPFSELRSPLVASAGSKRDPHLSTTSSVGLMFSQTGPASLSDIQLPIQVSPPPPPPPPLGMGRSTRQGEIRRSI